MDYNQASHYMSEAHIQACDIAKDSTDSVELQRGILLALLAIADNIAVFST